MKLLAMSGLIPEQICDVVRFTQYAGERNLPHYCGYASDFISQVMQDNRIDGAVFPKSCDSTRIMKSYLEKAGKFIYPMPVPTRRDGAARDYFASVIADYQSKIEDYFGIVIRDVKERSQLINARNEQVRTLYREIEGISFADYLESIHEMLKKPLREQKMRTSFQAKGMSGHRIFLIGSFLSHVSLVRRMEDYGLTVVGDNLPESGRMLSAPPVNVGGDLYREIAGSILGARVSPTQNAMKQILAEDLEEIRQKEIEGVIFLTQKYCEPYDFLYAVYKKALEGRSIPVLKISLSDTGDADKAELMLEAFADTLM